jgi:lysophospholipase L1-like esterase
VTAWIACAKAPPREAADAPKAARPELNADAGLPAESPGPWVPTKYAAVGDSFTIGTGSTPDRSFPARLAARWPSASLANFAVNGFTSSDVIQREVPQVRAFHPDFATIAIGANDIVRGVDEPTYRAHLRTIFTALGESAQRCHVIALPQPDWSVSPAARSFGSADAIADKIRAFNAILKDEALTHGARYVDLFPAMRRQADAHMIAADGLHPSAEAYAAWAIEIGSALEAEPLPEKCP